MNKEVFKPVESMPEFPGGVVEMMKFISKNTIYPSEAKKQEIVGQPLVKFVVDSTGLIKNIQINQSSGNKLLDEEALRVVSTMPKWKPGVQGVRKVPVLITLPVSFNVNGKLPEFKKKLMEQGNLYYNEGVKEFGLNNFKLAKENYKKAIALNCYDTDSKYNLGATYLKLNQKDSACVVWEDLKNSFNKKDKEEAEKLIKKYCSN